MEEWISELLSGILYILLKSVWNLDETACFGQALPELVLGKKGRKLNNYFSCYNSAGRKESAIVICMETEKPRCFKGIDISKLHASNILQSV